MKKSFLFLFCLFFSVSLFSQVDSIKNFKENLSNTNDDIEKIILCNRISKTCLYYNIKDAKKYADMALSLAKEKIDDSLLLADSYYSVGSYHTIKSNFEMAVANFNSAEYIYEKKKNYYGIVRCKNKISRIKQIEGDYVMSITLINTAIEIADSLINNTDNIAEKNKYKKEKAESYYVLGAINHYLGNNSKAVKWVKKNLEICNSIGNKDEICMSLYVFAETKRMQADSILKTKEGDIRQKYLENKNNEFYIALDSFRNCLESCIEIDNKYFIANCLQGIGSVNEKINPDSVEHYYKSCLIIFIDFEADFQIAEQYYRYGMYYQSIKEYKKAEKYLDSALVKAKNISSYTFINTKDQIEKSIIEQKSRNLKYIVGVSIFFFIIIVIILKYAEKKRYVKEISGIARLLTSGNSVKDIIDNCFDNVNKVMNKKVDVFWIGIYDKEKNILDFPYGKEYEINNSGEKKEIPHKRFYNSLEKGHEDTNRLAVKCFNEEKKIFEKNLDEYYEKTGKKRLVPQCGGFVNTIIYLPLIVKSKKIGVITVQSKNKNAYTTKQSKRFEDIANFTAPALYNAIAYENEIMLLKAIDEVPSPIFILDEETKKYIKCNQEYLNLVGKTSFKEVVGKTVSELYSFDTEKALMLEKKDEELFANPNIPQDFEESIYENKELKVYRTLKTCYINSEGKIVGLIGIMTDITKHKIDIKRLKHLFNSPLSSIRGYIDNIKLNLNKEHNYKRIDENLKNMEDFINRTVDIDHLKNRVFNPKKGNIRSFCTKLVVDREKYINLICEEKKFFFDNYLLGIILDNLISNSIKYTSPKDYEINLTITFNNSDTIIKIQDNGVGIPKEDLNKIFEFGERAKNAKANCFGNGIGLAFVKECVKLHKGFIKVESKIKQGTVFEITLPQTKK